MIEKSSKKAKKAEENEKNKKCVAQGLRETIQLTETFHL